MGVARPSREQGNLLNSVWNVLVPLHGQESLTTQRVQESHLTTPLERRSSLHLTHLHTCSFSLSIYLALFHTCTSHDFLTLTVFKSSWHAIDMWTLRHPPSVIILKAFFDRTEGAYRGNIFFALGLGHIYSCHWFIHVSAFLQILVQLVSAPAQLGERLRQMNGLIHAATAHLLFCNVAAQ